jgi:hypothetical protein
MCLQNFIKYKSKYMDRKNLYWNVYKNLIIYIYFK